MSTPITAKPVVRLETPVRTLKRARKSVNSAVITSVLERSVNATCQNDDRPTRNPSRMVRGVFLNALRTPLISASSEAIINAKRNAEAAMISIDRSTDGNDEEVELVTAAKSWTTVLSTLI